MFTCPLPFRIHIVFVQFMCRFTCVQVKEQYEWLRTTKCSSVAMCNCCKYCVLSCQYFRATSWNAKKSKKMDIWHYQEAVLHYATNNYIFAVLEEGFGSELISFLIPDHSGFSNSPSILKHREKCPYWHNLQPSQHCFGLLPP